MATSTLELCDVMKIWKNTATLDAYVPELSASAAPHEAEIAIIGSKPINIDEFPNLKGVFKCGIGTDNVPFDACEVRGVHVGLPSQKTAEVIYEETANFATMLVLQHLYAGAGSVEEWRKGNRRLLGNKKVLVVGTGRIGSRVRDKLSNMVRVRTFDQAIDRHGDLWPLLGEADAVTLHIPLIAETASWFDEHKLGAMADGAVLINTARGAIVDENALLAEIASGRLRAAFDVFWSEPYHGPLRAYHPERFSMTPHVASTCVEFLEGLANDFREFGRQFQRG